MTKWKRSISATPPRIASPRRAERRDVPQNSRFARYFCGTAK